MRKERATEAPGILTEVIKGALFASAASLLIIVLYAAAIWQQWLPGESINIMNTAIKVFCAAMAGLIAVRRCKRRAWLTGALAGLVFSAFAYAVFSILAGVFTFSPAVFADMGIGALSGMLSAMIYRASAGRS